MHNAMRQLVVDPAQPLAPEAALKCTGRLGFKEATYNVKRSYNEALSRLRSREKCLALFFLEERVQDAPI